MQNVLESTVSLIKFYGLFQNQIRKDFFRKCAWKLFPLNDSSNIFDSMSHFMRGYDFRAIECVGVIIHFAPIGYAFSF